MKKIFIALCVLIVLTWCGKIEPINNISQNNESRKTNISTKTNDNKNDYDKKLDDKSPKLSSKDWIDLNENTWIHLDEEEIIIKRFDLLANAYKNHSDLMNSIQYKNFVKYIQDIFNKYRDEWSNISDEKNNYLFNILIPKIVIKDYVITWKISEKEAELIIQSIKRNDLNTLEDKKLLTEKFKIYFEENKYNPFVKNLNIEGLSKEDKIKMITDYKEWLIYKILSNRYNWNKTWIWYKPSDMEANFMDYLDKKLETTFWIVWVTEKEVKEYIYKENNLKTLDDLWANILSDFKAIIKKYNLEWKIPLKRYYRNDERNSIFTTRENIDSYTTTLSNWDSKNFVRDIEKLRFKIYLLSYFWRNRTDLNEEQWLWSSRARSDFIDPKLWKWVQNLFRLSRYAPWEEVKIDLNKNTVF